MQFWFLLLKTRQSCVLSLIKLILQSRRCLLGHSVHLVENCEQRMPVVGPQKAVQHQSIGSRLHALGLDIQEKIYSEGR